MSKLLFVCAFAVIISSVFALTCTNPKVESSSFTTQDATIVSQIAFISEFTLKCSNGASETVPLFAEVDGRLSPVARIGTDKFQVSLIKIITLIYKMLSSSIGLIAYWKIFSMRLWIL